MHSDFVLPALVLADFIMGAIVAVAVGISWYYFFRYFAAVKAGQNEAVAESLPAVSLVVAAKNEIHNLQKNIPLWLAQAYPRFELVIADDGSTDDTSQWITTTFENDSRVKLVLLDPEYVKMHGKKIALTLAYKKAQFNHFVLTDADCAPASNQWLKQMASRFSGGHEIVLGYSPYEKKAGMLNRIIRYDTVLTALQYLGFALKHKPYMGVGRNLAYTRQVYDRQNGFSTHAHIPAGDDDLFVQEAANSKNVAVCLDPESFTFSTPKLSFKDWRRQKRRHMWVGKFYRSDIKNSLVWFPFAQILFLASVVTWFFLGSWFVYPLAFILIKWGPEWIIFGSRTKRLAAPDLAALYPLLNLFYSVWYVIAGTFAFFAKNPKW